MPVFDPGRKGHLHLQLWLLIVLLAPARLPAQDAETTSAGPFAARNLLVAGHGDHLWVLRQVRGGEFELFYRDAEVPADLLYPAIRRQGRPIALAAWQATAYCVYQDLSVQAIRPDPTPPTHLRPMQVTQLGPLPPSSRLMTLVATRLGPAALVRTGGSATDRSPEDSDVAGDAVSPREVSVLQWQRGKWMPLPLPRALAGRSIRTLAVRPYGQRESLVLATEQPGEDGFYLHEHDGESWTETHFTQSLAASTQALGVRGNLFLLHRDDDTLAIERVVPDQGLAKAGALDWQEDWRRWWAVPVDPRIAVVVVDQSGRLHWARRHVNDPADQPLATSELKTGKPAPLLPDAQTILVVATVLIGMLFLFGSARRDPNLTVPRLPQGMQPAGPRRGIAAAIDLAGPVAFATFFYGLETPAALVQEWMTDPSDWEAVEPGLVTIGLFVGHTLICELASGRTLGKWIAGCVVVNYAGEPAKAWQVLARNFFKIVELAPPFLLLILPLLNAHHQRLGDLIGRTVVIDRPSATALREHAEEELDEVIGDELKGHWDKDDDEG